MTILEEIEQLKTDIAASADDAAKGELLISLLYKYNDLNSLDAKPYIEILLQLADKIHITRYRAWALFYSANMHRRAEQNDAAINLAIQALKLFEQLEDKNGLASACNSIGSVKTNQNDYAGAMEYYNRALAIKQQLKDERGVANVHNNIGIVYENQGEYADALKSHLKSLEIRIMLDDQVGIAGSHYQLGRLYSNKSNYAAALTNHLLAQEIWKKLGDKHNLTYSYTNIGSIYLNQGNYPEAMKNYLQALEINEIIDNKSGAARCYNNMGMIYQQQLNYGAALKNFYKALQSHHQTGNKMGAAHTNYNIATIYEIQGNAPGITTTESKALFEKALQTHLQVLQSRIEMSDKPGTAWSHKSVGDVYENLGDYTAALSKYKLALQISESIGEKKAIAAFYQAMGRVMAKQGQYSDAIKTQLKALKIAEEIGFKEGIRNSCQLLAQSFKAHGDFESALNYHEKYHRIENEMLGEETQKQITSLTFMHDLEQKEKQAEIEKLRHVELKNALNQLQLEKAHSEQLLGHQVAALKEMALQAQMNPHFVFNSLNAIQSFILKSNAEKATDYLVSFSKLIRLVLENSRKPTVSLAKDVEALEYYIQLEALRFESKFTWQVICDPGVNRDEINIPPMLVQPFVENAIIHGLQPLNMPGLLTVSIKLKDDETLYITIEDNGVGRPKAAEGNIYAPGIAARIIKLNSYQGRKAVVHDLVDEQNLAAGTLVEIELAV